MGIAGSFFNAARAYKDHVAVQSQNKELTFGALAQNVSRLSNALAGLGLGPGDVVAGIMPNRPEPVELDLACSAGGYIRTLLNSRAPADDYVYCLNFCRGKNSRLRLFPPRNDRWHPRPTECQALHLRRRKCALGRRVHEPLDKGFDEL